MAFSLGRVPRRVGECSGKVRDYLGGVKVEKKRRRFKNL